MVGEPQKRYECCLCLAKTKSFQCSTITASMGHQFKSPKTAASKSINTRLNSQTHRKWICFRNHTWHQRKELTSALGTVVPEIPSFGIRNDACTYCLTS